MAFPRLPLRPGIATLALLMAGATAWALDRDVPAGPEAIPAQIPAAVEAPALAPPENTTRVDSAPAEESPGTAEDRGLASYYADAFHGLRTASGERFDMQALTAAHRTLPFGTRVRVTNLRNGQAVVVRINDRGPFVRGRVLDVSYAAAKSLGLVSTGVARVKVQVL